MSDSNIRRDIVDCCRRVYQKGYVASNDGNLSVRVGPDHVICTPRGRNKGSLQPDDLVDINMQGIVLNGNGLPSTEIPMHLAIYNTRNDAAAVVHAHPIYATGFATSGMDLSGCVAPEIITTLGSIPLAAYGTPSTEELPRTVVDVMQNADACLMANHGVVTCGKDIFDAYYKLERVEHYAHILFVSRMLGGERLLTREQVGKLDNIRQTYGTQNAPNPGCIACGEECLGPSCSLYEKKQAMADDIDVTIRQIIEARA
jgi:L-fuculose-phosphate aldolase